MGLVKVGNLWVNPDHVQQVSPNAVGSRLWLAGGMHADVPPTPDAVAEILNRKESTGAPEVVCEVCGTEIVPCALVPAEWHHLRPSTDRDHEPKVWER